MKKERGRGNQCQVVCVERCEDREVAIGEGNGLVVALYELSLYEASALVSRSLSMKLVDNCLVLSL